MVLVVREFVRTCDLLIRDPLNAYTQGWVCSVVLTCVVIVAE